MTRSSSPAASAVGLARSAFALDLRRNRWRQVPGPTPREHLAVTAAGGRVYALAGRTAGLDTNVRTLESWRPGARDGRACRPFRSRAEAPGATAVGRTIVSIGGEAPTGTIASVYAYDTRHAHVAPAPDLPTPRHGLGVVAAGRTVYAIAGGPRPGLTTSGADRVPDAPVKLLRANGIRFAALADGPEDGPLVLLLHGFPELSRSWRHQLPALAAAGYRAVAPDLRGYGGTERAARTTCGRSRPTSPA